MVVVMDTTNNNLLSLAAGTIRVLNTGIKVIKVIKVITISMQHRIIEDMNREVGTTATTKVKGGTDRE
jgi:hypothetical protein